MTKRFVQNFLNSAAVFPHNQAVGDAEGSYSYSELNKYSSTVAECLFETVESEGNRRTAILLPRKRTYFVAVVGAMKAGFAYISLDPEYPDERCRLILLETEAGTIITDKAVVKKHSALIGELRDNGIVVLDIDDMISAASTDAKTSRFDTEAEKSHDGEGVIYYTSGTTGKPKGVIHGPVGGDNEAVAEYCKEPDERTRFACMGKFSFVASGCFLFPPLTKGGFVYIINEDEMSTIRNLTDAIRKQRITAMSIPPKLALSVLEAEPDLQLDYLVVAGERIAYVPDTEFPIFDVYGSTESSHVLIQQMSKAERTDLMGEPLPGIEVYLVDKNGEQIEETGITGELCVSTPYMSKGYIQRPEQEKKKFKEFAFAPGKRLCCMGDLMEWVETDSGKRLRLLGRKDNMVKINGQRVELEEVERKVNESGLADDVLCSVVSVNGTDSLCCYYVKEDSAGTREDSRAISNFLRKELPSYMVPCMYHRVASIPRNANGKIDRFAELSVMDDPKTEKEESQGRNEWIICQTISEALGGLPISPESDLLSIGMNSLAYIKVSDALQRRGYYLRPSDLMRYTTANELAQGLSRLIWYYKEQDPSLPTICYMCGVTVISHHHPRLKLLSGQFNVIVIEPIQNHFDKVFDVYEFDEVVRFYELELELLLSRNGILAGIMGNSFGGDLAVNIARIWNERQGYAVPVIMGDTYIGLCDGPTTVEDILADPFNKLEDSAEEQVKYLNIVYYLNCSRKEMMPYSGHVAYLEAMKNNNVMNEDEKVGLARKLYKDIEVMELPDTTHYELSTSEELALFFAEIAEKTFIGEKSLHVKSRREVTKKTEKVILDVAKEILDDISLTVDDDLMIIGMNSLNMIGFASQLQEKGIKIRTSDIMRYRTVRKIAEGLTRMAWIYGTYDPEKPVIVLLCGVVMVEEYLQIIKRLMQRFNVMVIEPIFDHFDLVFDSPDFSEIIRFYADETELILKDYSKPCGFYGTSFGGDIAYNMAAEWERRTGDRLPVLMGDTYIDILEKKTIEEIRATLLNNDVPAEVIAWKLGMVYDINNTRGSIEHYGGHVAYINTPKEYDEEKTMNKLELVKSLFSDLAIIDHPEISHSELYMTAQGAQIVFDAAVAHLLPEGSQARSDK